MNIDITPRTHHDGEVPLALKILVSSISGLPIQPPQQPVQPPPQP